MPRNTFLSSQPFTYAMLAGGLWLLAASLVSWLTIPEFSSQLLPEDILDHVRQWLGQSDSNDRTPSEPLETTTVFARLLITILALGFVARFRGAERLEVAVKQTAIIAGSVLLWWACEWLGAFPAIGGLRDYAVGILPIWMALLMGTLTWTWVRAIVAPSVDAKASQNFRRPAILLATAALGWVGVSYWMNACLYEQLLIPHGDSAMYEEHLWNVWHGKGFRSYLDQGLFLGEHIQVIHLLLLPLHIIWPSHLLLELAESTALAICVWPLFTIVKRHTGSQWAGCLLGLAWLSYYPMHFLDIAIDQKTFRPIVLSLPFLFWMIEAAETGRYRLATVCLILALSAKEDVALVAFPLLAIIAWRSDLKEGLTLSRWKPALMSVGCLAYLLLAVLMVIPWFRSGDAVHYSRYFGDLGSTPGDLIRNAVQQPSRILATLLSVRTLLYVSVFLFPLAALPVWRPMALLAGSLTFGMLSLLEFGDGGLPVPYHHFHAPLLPVLFWATALAIGSLKSSEHPSAGGSLLRNITQSPADAAFLVSCCCLTTALFGSMMPNGATFWSDTSRFGMDQLYRPTDPEAQERTAMAAEVERLVPMDAVVASTDFIHTRLTHRKRSYDYSDYLRAVNNYQPGVPADTEYIVIDTRHPYSTIKTAGDVPELKSPGEWQLLPDSTNGAFLILRRNKEANSSRAASDK